MLPSKSLFIFFCWLTLSLPAQNYDYNWIFGYGVTNNPNDSMIGLSVLNFATDPPTASYVGWQGMRFQETNTSVSDAQGNLQFYTNGIYIADPNHAPMPQSEELNPGPVADLFGSNGYIVNQGALVLPSLADTNQYYLMHANLEFPMGDLTSHCSKVYYSLVDMSLRNGLGRPVEKNVPILSDTMDIGKVTAVKHANGRDWWILMFESDAPYYHRILFDPAGFHVLEKDSIFFTHTSLGGSVFSPDGAKYVRYSFENIVTGHYFTAYDFDRCSGYLSNPVQDTLVDGTVAGGIAISPNSRYAYLSASIYVYQYDLAASDIISTKDTVAIYDGYVSLQPTTFYLPQLGPNGKIYISTFGTTDVLHVIEEPDLGGEACQVNQHSFPVPTYTTYTMPNFPNYRLGPLEGSACDTLGNISDAKEVVPPEENEFQIYPNPTPGLIHIKSPTLQNGCSLHLYDALGRLQLHLDQTGSSKECTLDAQHLPAGLYYLVVQKAGKVVQRERVVVHHL